MQSAAGMMCAFPDIYQRIRPASVDGSILSPERSHKNAGQFNPVALKPNPGISRFILKLEVRVFIAADKYLKRTFILGIISDL